MLGEFYSNHRVDPEGKPAGGESLGVGMTVVWQNGPLGRGDDRLAPNGAFVETLIAAAKDRIDFYQSGQFACDENANAIRHLELALKSLNSRTSRREAAGVEGTHEGS